MTEDEVRRLLSETAGRNQIIWRILTSCGLRIGEVLALEVADLTSAGLRVDASALNGKAGRTKNGKPRTVPISSTLRAELVAWCSMLPLGQTLLFTGTRTQMLRRNGDAVQNILSEARTAAAIPHLTFRMCRTTFSTLYESDVKDIQVMLGHSSASITLSHYKKAIPERAQTAVEDLDRRFLVN